MEIEKINKIKLATELAHNSMKDEVFSNEYRGTIIFNEDHLYKKQKDKTFVYRKEFQKVFDKHYDYYLDMIEKSIIK